MICDGCEREVEECLGYGSCVPRLRAQIEILEFQASALPKAHAEIVRLREKLDRVFTAVLRYESRHDLDPERAKLWTGLKAAFLDTDSVERGS